MKKAISTLIITLLSICPATNIFADHQMIEVATLDYCPLICDQQKEPKGRKGIMVEIAEEIFRRENVKMHLTIMPFSRAIAEVSHCNFDALLGGDKNQAPKLFYPHFPICHNWAQIFTTKDNAWQYKNINSLDSIKLIAIKDFGYANKEIEQYIQNPKHENVLRLTGDNTTNRGIDLLLQKKADAFIDGHLSFYYMKSIHPISENDSFKVASSVLGIFRNYLSFNPAAPMAKKWAEMIDRQMPKLVEEGFIREVYARYGIDDSSISLD